MNKIAVVDELDNIIAYEEKMYVHEKAILHRAFSLLIYNKSGEMLVQRRSFSKYHSPGLWTNACCSHEIEIDDDIMAAVKRRVTEELGIEIENIVETGVIRYRCDFQDGLSENEIDHIFTCEYNGDIPFNKEEIHEIMWISLEKLKKWVESKPSEFTYWFKVMVKNNMI
ncbi:isopentenyl-diphosphate delta-isomerase [Hathewaya proteolytica DSM 3090]|uniref:Isopentenyl-diphosphate delta-isomerase n=1 Tax=Hathewaya proteolytica DSM 3090 TaxID=1121331 RepID=A0A1M6PC15_9CLOT|nr:isopentenyl-diphosphate Delta-isomerase [Hathewaya proteolytica]SHK05493.1 isopentenyl-diphosphate delta-isomerase [Hathewaya proteolytica DSM 3090]